MRECSLKNKSSNDIRGKEIFMPYIGPATIEEAYARIDEAEKDIAKGRGYAIEDVIAEARKKTISC